MTDDGFAPVLGPIGTLIEQAYTYAGLGLDIFPVNPTNKTPLVSQLTATTDLDTIETWWTQWPNALLGHRIAPQHLIFDIDPRHGGKDTWDALKLEMPAFVTRTHLSGRGDGGGHVWFQRPTDQVTITRLDTWAKAHGTGQQVDQRWVCGIDILRHEHRYTILPPSHHPATGRPYYWAKGKGLNLEPAPMPTLLVDLIERDHTPPTPPTAPSEPRYSDPDSVADWYTTTHTWAEILARHGWQLVAGDGQDGSRWRHPTATSAFSATIRYGCLFVYSPNTPFDVTYPDEPHGYTLFRAWAVLDHQGDLSAAGRAARLLRGPTNKTPPSSNGNTPQRPRELVLTSANGIAPQRVRWCWDQRLALGTLGLLAGPEGLGKSTVAYTIAADITRGLLPGEYHGTPKAVLVCASEDSWAHTIVPRFMAAGADLTKVYRIDVHLDDDIIVGLSLPLDILALEQAATDVGAALLILDPLISRLDGLLDSHKDGDVRRALEPLISIADNTAMSIIGLIHHNKSGSTDPLQLVMASKAFTAVARSVHTIVRDPDDETGLRRYFGTPKNNLGSIDLPTLTFTIESWFYDTQDGQGATGRIIWGEQLHEPISDLLARAAQPPEQRTAQIEANEWLEEFMDGRGGSALASEAKTCGQAAGHSKTAIERASIKLKLKKPRLGYQGPVSWVSPPSSSSSPQSPSEKYDEYDEYGTDQEVHTRQQPIVVTLEAPPARETTMEGPEPYELIRYCRCGQTATDISGLCPGCITNPGTLPPIDPNDRF